MLGWAKEAVYALSYFVLTVSGILGGVPPNEFDPTKPNIVLVYGLGATSPTMLPLKAKLEEVGFNVIIADIGWAQYDIDILAKRLDKFLDEREKVLNERHGLVFSALKNNIVLFGHSMGGLIILAAQTREQKLLGLQVVSAGTPFRGSPAAYIAFWSKAASQMRPDSEWLTLLRWNMEENPRKLLQIKARKDELVPADSSVIEGYPSYVIPVIGHAALIFEFEPEILKQFFPGHTWPKPINATSARKQEIQSP